MVIQSNQMKILSPRYNRYRSTPTQRTYNFITNNCYPINHLLVVPTKVKWNRVYKSRRNRWMKIYHSLYNLIRLSRLKGKLVYSTSINPMSQAINLFMSQAMDLFMRILIRRLIIHLVRPTKIPPYFTCLDRNYRKLNRMLKNNPRNSKMS